MACRPARNPNSPLAARSAPVTPRAETIDRARHSRQRGRAWSATAHGFVARPGARERTAWTPTISSNPPIGSNSEPQTGHRSPIGTASLSVLYRRVVHARHLKCTIASSYSRERIKDASRGSLGPITSASVQAPSRRAFRRRRASIADETRRDPRSRSSSPRLRAAPTSRLCVIVLEPFPSLCRIRAQGRGLRTPARSIQ